MEQSGVTWGTSEPRGWCAAVFLGTHTPRLDDKGRLFLPAKFRDELSGGVVITKGQEHCLYVFTRAAFSAKAEELQSASLTSRAARDYGRMFFSSAYDELPDKTGRVTIPAALRQYAGLDRDCASSAPTRAWRSGTPRPGPPTRPSRKPPSPTRTRAGCPCLLTPAAGPCDEASDRSPSWRTFPGARRGAGGDLAAGTRPPAHLQDRETAAAPAGTSHRQHQHPSQRGRDAGHCTSSAVADEHTPLTSRCCSSAAWPCSPRR